MATTASPPFADPLQESLAKQIAELERHELGVRAGDAEALHQFRIATRRARALLRPCAGVDELERELRWLAVVLGPVRDLDVLIAHVRELIDDLDVDRAGGEAILAGLEAKRAHARDALLAALDGGRYPEMLLRFRIDLSRLGADNERLNALVVRELRRLLRAYGELGSEPADDALHRVRIKAKRTRYAAELAGGRRAARLAKAAKTLQDSIGIHQDAVIAEQEVRAVASKEALLAAGRIVERERGRRREVRAAVPKQWKRLERAAARVDPDG